MQPVSKYYNVNGVRLHVLECGPADGPVTIFLHGFPEFSYGWLKQIDYFAEQDFRVIAPDQRGYNLSDKPAGINSYRLRHLVADITSLISLVSTRPVTLVGHDWGGGVAWAIAMHHPHLLRKMVILNMPHLQAMKQTLKRNIGQMLKSWYAAFFQLPLFPELVCRTLDFKFLEKSLRNTSNKSTFGKQDLALYKQAWQRPGALHAMINWYRAYIRNDLEIDINVDVSTMIIWGEKDAF